MCSRTQKTNDLHLNYVELNAFLLKSIIFNWLNLNVGASAEYRYRSHTLSKSHITWDNILHSFFARVLASKTATKFHRNSVALSSWRYDIGSGEILLLVQWYAVISVSSGKSIRAIMNHSIRTVEVRIALEFKKFQH